MICHRYVTRDSRVTTPVSHPTNTTPHHTLSLVKVVCGVSGSDQIQSDRHLGPLAAPIGFGDGR